MDLHLELIEVLANTVTLRSSDGECVLTVPRWLCEDDREPVIAGVTWQDVEDTVRAVTRGA